MDINELLASRIQTKPNENAGKLILVYGPHGIGKTSTFCQAPKTVLVSIKDDRTADLKGYGDIRADLPTIQATSFDDSVDIIKALSDGGHDFRNVVIDGPSGAEDWLDRDVLNNNFEGNPEKYAAFGRGDSIASTRWQEFVDAVLDLARSGVWVFLLCHKQVITEKNAGGNDYLKNTLALSKGKIPPLAQFADAILYMDFIIGEKSVDKISGTAKVVGGETRVMYTQPSASYEAKNSMKLPQIIQLGNSPQEAFKAFFAAVKAGKKVTTAKEAK